MPSLFEDMTQLGDVMRIRFPARRLCEQGLRTIRERIYRLVDGIGQRTIYLDLESVDSPTADGLGRLIVLNNELQAAGHELVLYNVNDWTYEVFELVGLTNVLDVRPPTWQIVNSFASWR